MAIAVDQNYDKAQRKISTNNLAQFAGVDCQLLVEKETHRPIIMDGSTIGGKFKCASTDEVKAVETVANNAISQAYADEHYLGITAKAESAKIADNATNATNADTAIKASQDANGNVIPETYATKSELTSGLATKQPVGDYRTKSELDSIYLGINGTAVLADGLSQKGANKLYLEQNSVNVASTQRYECTMHGVFNLRKAFKHVANRHEASGSCTVGIFKNDEQIFTQKYTWSEINGGGHTTQNDIKGTDYFFHKGDVVTIRAISGNTTNTTVSMSGTFTGNWIALAS